MSILLTAEEYREFDSWGKKFPNEVDLKKILYHPSWKNMFNELFADDRLKSITEKKLFDEIKKNKKVIMYPPPILLFDAFKKTPLDKVLVVILGQDPYFNPDHAMGLAFSVPYGTETPSSLKNIYKNLLNNKHIRTIPESGNLEFWALQGVLLLNTSLTVLNGKENANGHKHIWKWFTEKIIRYISANCDNVVFVLWGKEAHEKIVYIDQDKHDVVMTSHPSGLSADKPSGNYPPFNSYDSFGKINTCLKKKEKKIIWQL